MKYIAFFAIMLMPQFSMAAIHVPSDQPTIQAGIDAAEAGDTVIVACGTYLESEILMRSGIYLRSEDALSECVVIDAQEQGVVLRCEAVDFVSIEGVTFTHGLAAYGGGILVSNSHAIAIANCLFRENRALFDGGGLAADDAEISISDCAFLDNTADHFGGGISCSASTNIICSDCVFTSNIAMKDGGGLNSEGVMQLSGCEFSENRADFFDAFNSHGGGVNLSWGECLVSGCRFSRNSAFLGGGLHATYVTLSIENSLFYENAAIDTGIAGGGAIRLHDSDCNIAGCTFADNQALWEGSSIEATYYSICIVSNSIMVRGVDSGAVRCNENSTISCNCCNVFGNELGDWTNCLSGQNGTSGNISNDPQFCGVLGSGNYYLQSDSPCAPGNHPAGEECGLIGALSVGCGGVSVERQSWSKIKELY